MGILRWAGASLVGGAAALFVNYKVARHPVDLHKKFSEELGSAPTPLRFPADMETTFLVKFVNSIFYTTSKFGWYTPRIQGKNVQAIIEELRLHVKPDIYEYAKECVNKMDESINMELGSEPMEIFLMKGMVMKVTQTWIDCEKEFARQKSVLDTETLKPQIIIVGVCLGCSL